ncbi:MAG: hypothetical protein GPJ30_22905 [Microcystis aeruginosa BS11-05]|nr:hypothetical protein [Microcystis aeruginosa BS11-05]
MGGTSQAVPYISAIATLGQQIARTYLGRELTLTEFRTLLDTTSNLIIDGDDENDNVTNTGISYPRINALALAENILNLNDSNSNPDLVNPGNNNNNGSNTVTNTVSLVHNVTLTAGQILTGINFGNQQLPSNQPPTLNNINKSGDEDNPINFSQSDFTSAFNDADGNTLVKIQITALPNNGVLQLNNTAIAINEEIAVSDLNNLTFSPNTNFNGNITFSWNGFDGSVYSINSAQVNDNQLTLDYQDNQSGIANITIRGTSNGKTVDDTLVVTVNPVDDAPTVLNPITDVNVDEDAANTVIDITNVFTDIDNDPTSIVKTVFVNNNTGLVTATIVDNQLTLDYQDNQSGIANITIRGTSNGKTVDDTLVVTVNPVNDAPTLQQEIANQTATENQPFSFTIPANTFTDIDDDNLTYTLATETVLPSGITFDAATGTFSGTPSDTASGIYNLTVIASDSAGEKANDTFSLNVLNAVNGSSSGETVNGTSGNDHINAGAGNDTVNGGEGNDILDGGTGNDRLAGGPGDDTYIVDSSRDVAIEN